jgi:hypothetical protein
VFNPQENRASNIKWRDRSVAWLILLVAVLLCWHGLGARSEVFVDGAARSITVARKITYASLSRVSAEGVFVGVQQDIYRAR